MMESLPSWDRWTRFVAAALHVLGAAYVFTDDSSWMQPLSYVAAALLLFTAIEGHSHGETERYICWILAGTAVLHPLSFSVLQAGIRAHPNSNIPGVGLLAAPFFWLSLLILSIGPVTWMVIMVSRLMSRKR
jgi:hypothetical protein